jgi:hypothetical protein
VKILLDHNLDWRLSNYLIGHEVKTALEMAWHTLKNGVLLTEAEKFEFSTLITTDKGIKTQQSMKGRLIGVVILRAPNNRLETHLTMISEVIRPWPPYSLGKSLKSFTQISGKKMTARRDLPESTQSPQLTFPAALSRLSRLSTKPRLITLIALNAPDSWSGEFLARNCPAFTYHVALG